MALVEHLEKIRHFYRLTQFRSIREAAIASGISQAGLSKSLAALELELESTLFVRSPQGLVLTKEGELLLRASKRIIEESTAVEAKLRARRGATVPRKLRIGMYDSIVAYFFAELKEYLGTIYAELALELYVDSSENLAAGISREELDLAIGANLATKGSRQSEFFLLFEDEYSFYISPKAATPSAAKTLILHPLATDAQGRSIESYLAESIAKLGAHSVLNFETIKTLTIQGLGIGVLPTQVARPALALNQLIPHQLPRRKQFFGRHGIGFLASAQFLTDHREFADDIFRLGQRWRRS